MRCNLRLAVLLFTVVAAAPCSPSNQAAQDSSSASGTEAGLRDAYAKHMARVRMALPPHSALPPVLDLTKQSVDKPTQDRAWEDEYDLLMGPKGIFDPGIPTPSEATSIGTTYIDAVGVFALPARNSRAVVIATPSASETAISPNHRMVYSRYRLRISKVLKGSRKDGFINGATVIGVTLGGSVIFPSHHLATFILAHAGFPEVGKQYLLFLWKPPHSKETFMISQAYLIANGTVYPIDTSADISAYQKGMPLNEFETKVKDTIAKDVNSE